MISVLKISPPGSSELSLSSLKSLVHKLGVSLGWSSNLGLQIHGPWSQFSRLSAELFADGKKLEIREVIAKCNKDDPEVVLLTLAGACESQKTILGVIFFYSLFAHFGARWSKMCLSRCCSYLRPCARPKEPLRASCCWSGLWLSIVLCPHSLTFAYVHCLVSGVHERICKSWANQHKTKPRPETISNREVVESWIAEGTVTGRHVMGEGLAINGGTCVS